MNMPSSPAPKNVEISRQSVVAASTSPFTGLQQLQDWGASWLEASITLPPMKQSDAVAWVAWLLSLNGQATTFAVTNTNLLALIPTGMASGLWRLTSNTTKWSVNEGMIYGFQFTMRDATSIVNTTFPAIVSATPVNNSDPATPHWNAIFVSARPGDPPNVQYSRSDVTLSTGLQVRYIFALVSLATGGLGADSQGTVNLYTQFGGTIYQFTLHATQPIPSNPGGYSSALLTYQLPLPVTLAPGQTWSIWTQNSEVNATVGCEISDFSQPQNI